MTVERPAGPIDGECIPPVDSRCRRSRVDAMNQRESERVRAKKIETSDCQEKVLQSVNDWAASDNGMTSNGPMDGRTLGESVSSNKLLLAKGQHAETNAHASTNAKLAGRPVSSTHRTDQKMFTTAVFLFALKPCAAALIVAVVSAAIASAVAAATGIHASGESRDQLSELFQATHSHMTAVHAYSG